MPKNGNRLVPAELGLEAGDMIPFEGFYCFSVNKLKPGQKDSICFLAEGFDTDDKCLTKEYRHKTINMSIARFPDWTEQNRAVPIYFNLPKKKFDKGYMKITLVGWGHYEGEIIDPQELTEEKPLTPC